MLLDLDQERRTCKIDFLRSSHKPSQVWCQLRGARVARHKIRKTEIFTIAEWRDYGPRIRCLILVIRAVSEREIIREIAITILAKTTEREVFHLVDKFIKILLKTEKTAIATAKIIAQIIIEIKAQAEREISDS